MSLRDPLDRIMFTTRVTKLTQAARLFRYKAETLRDFLRPTRDMSMSTGYSSVEEVEVQR